MKVSRLHDKGISASISDVAVAEFKKGVEIRRRISLEALEQDYLGKGLTRRKLLDDINVGKVKVIPTRAQVSQSFLQLKRTEEINNTFNHPKDKPFNTTNIQYLTQDDTVVRPTHQALHELVYPRGHAFWIDHLPPIEQGCRCFIETVSKTVKVSPDNVDLGADFKTINTGVDGTLDQMLESTSKLAEKYLAAGGNTDSIIQSMTESLNVLQSAKSRSLFVQALENSGVNLTLVAGLVGLTLDNQKITSGNVNHAKDIYAQAIASRQNKNLALLGSLGYLLFDNEDGREGTVISDLTTASQDQIRTSGVLEHTVIHNSDGNTILTVTTPSITEFENQIIVAAGAEVTIQ